MEYDRSFMLWLKFCIDFLDLLNIGTVEFGLCELPRLMEFSLIFGQPCDKKTCAFVVMRIGKKFSWARGFDGQKSLGRHCLFCWSGLFTNSPVD